MNLTTALVLAVLAQRVPLPSGPPPPYFTQLADHAGLPTFPGATDGSRYLIARLSSPGVMASDASGAVFVATSGAAPGTSAIRVVAGDQVSTLAAALPFTVNEFGAMVVNPVTHELFLTVNTRHLIIKVDVTGAHSIFAGSSTVVSCSVLQLCFVGGFRDGLGTAAQFSGPNGLAIDSGGYLYVADSFNHAIRRVAPNGDVVTIISSSLADFEPRALLIDQARARFVYLSRTALYELTFNGVINLLAGAPTTNSQFLSMVDGEASVARFAMPVGLAMDAAGNIFVADAQTYVTFNPIAFQTQGAIRQVTPGRSRFPIYPTTVTTLSLSPAFIEYGLAPGQGWLSDTTLERPMGFTWVGSQLALSDSGRHTVRLIR